MAGPVTGSPWADRRVLVTGATGVLGSSLCRQLLDAGAHVVALVLDHDPGSALIRSGGLDRCSVVDGCLERWTDVERAVVGHGTDTIFHLGAQTIVSAGVRAPAHTFEVNVMGTVHVLEAARLHDDLVRRVVVASSDKAYGDSDLLPYTEDLPMNGVGPYDASKSCTDLVARSYARTYGLPAAVVRAGNIYGPGDLNWSRIVPGTIRSLLRGERPVIRSDGTLVRDYVYVDDVAAAYAAIAEGLDRPDVAGQAFNVGASRPLSVLDLYRLVSEATVGTLVDPLVLGQAPGEILEQHLDPGLVRSVVGWQAETALEDGLARTVDWYRDLFAAP